MDRFDDESICARCGRCCFEKFRDADGVVVFTDIPCPFLDVETRLCRVYAERLRRQPRCSSARHSAELGGLPHDCPYVADDPAYPRTSTLAERPHMRAVLPDLFPEFFGRKKPAPPDSRKKGKRRKKR